MSMFATFRCLACGTVTIQGRFKGADMYVPIFPCLKCKARTNHEFAEYAMIDERSDGDRMREKLQGAKR